MTFDNIENIPGITSAVTAATEFVYNVVAHNPTRGLIFSGEFGCGKTHIACAIANRLVLHARRVQFWPCFEILEGIKASFDHPDAANPIDAISDSPVLVIDDLGNERIDNNQRGDWAREQIFRIAYNRDIKSLPTVITTNLSRSEFKARLGGATTSRFFSACQWVDIKAPDYRMLH